jgi:hypothetical protein
MINPNIMALLQGAMSGNPLAGPIPPQNLTPGFRAPGTPGPMGFARPPQQQTPSIPGMGLHLPQTTGMQPSTSGAEMGAAENDGLASAIAGVQGIQPNPDGTFSPPPMPTDIGSGQGGGSFSDWLKKMFGNFGGVGGASAPRGLF